MAALFALTASAVDEARQAGPNRVSMRMLTPKTPGASTAADVQLVGQLRDVIENARFRIFYQPIASLHGYGVE